MLLLLIIFQTYSVYDANKKIWCVFRRADKTKVGKWAKHTQAVIDFDGGWYEVEPSRITTMIKWLPLPTIVKSLDYTPFSTRAIDPISGDASMSPETRKQLNVKDDIQALERGNENSLGGRGMKQGMLQQYIPLITICGFIIVGWFIYQLMGKVDQLGLSGNVIQTQLGKIMQNGGIK